MSKPLTRQILERARDLIGDKNHWCRGSLAKYLNFIDGMMTLVEKTALKVPS